MNSPALLPLAAPMIVEAPPLCVIVGGAHASLAAELSARLADYPTHVEMAEPRWWAPDGSLGRPGPAAVAVVSIGATAVDDLSVLRWLDGQTGAPVVLMSQADDESALLVALRNGAAGYLLEDLADQELIFALHRAAGGDVVVDPRLAGRMVLQLADGTWRDHSQLEGWGLRLRERQVLEFLIDGRSNREIARRLNLGEETVKTYLRSLYRKLGARDRTHAVALALGRRT